MDDLGPLDLFNEWYYLAKVKSPKYYNAFTLSTATLGGKPSSRIVLLKKSDQQGFVFYTNFNSRKSLELNSTPYATMCFYWESLQKQIRIEGKAERVSDGEANSYFATRPRGAQIGAWASKQSAPCGEMELEKRIETYTEKFQSKEVPRPEFWGGFRLRPQSMEFWEDRKMRLHVRHRFEFKNEDWTQDWTKQRLFP